MLGKDQGGDGYPARQSPGRSLGQRFQGWLAEVQKQSRSWNTPFRNLKTIEAYLKPSRHFRNEIAEIKTYIKELELERQKFKLA